MVVYSVSSKQLLLNTVLLTVQLALVIVGYFEVTKYLDLPVVTYADGKCASVTNFNNGDAYNCNDVDIVLRKYRKAG